MEQEKLNALMVEVAAVFNRAELAHPSEAVSVLLLLGAQFYDAMIKVEGYSVDGYAGSAQSALDAVRGAVPL